MWLSEDGHRLIGLPRVVVRLVVAALLTAPVVGCSGPASSSASCASPSLTLSPDPARPGSRLTLTGDYFSDQCVDTSVNGTAPSMRPAEDLQVRLVQGDRSWTLADHVSASGTLMRFAVAVVIPPDASPGPAELVVNGYRQTIHLDSASLAQQASSACPNLDFILDLVTDVGGQSSPVAAAEWFAAHDSGLLAPRHGWRVTARDGNGATLSARASTVHTAQEPDGTWRVDRGSIERPCASRS